MFSNLLRVARHKFRQTSDRLAVASDKRLCKPYFDDVFYLLTYADVGAAGIDPLGHYCTHGWREGREIRADFSAPRYGSETGVTGNPLIHAIRAGVVEPLYQPEGEGGSEPVTIIGPDGEPQNHPAPNPAWVDLIAQKMDVQYYLDTYPDVTSSGVSPALHYLLLGWRLDYDPSPVFSTRFYLDNNADVAQRQDFNPFLHYLLYGAGDKARKTSSVGAVKTLARFRPGGDLADVVREATLLEPMIAYPLTENRRLTSPLLSNYDLISVAAGLRRHFSGRHFDHIVVMPHVRMSGAARVAGCYARALAKITDPSRILIIQTDGPEMERPEWFPDGVEIFDLSSRISGIESAEKRALVLLDVVQGVGAKTLTNVNSRLMWDLLGLYGRQMAEEFTLIAYLFTWEENPDGTRVGYPIFWLRDTIHVLDAIFCDADYLVQDIRQRFGFTGDKAWRISALHTPLARFCEGEQLRSYAQPDSNRVLWVGRFDRQKRPDILRKIALDHPHLEFHAYGRAVLDQHAQQELRGVPNLHVMPEFTRFQDVFEAGYAFYLYTAQWDGIPNSVLDAISAGFPVIAPDIGGLSEVIGPETGWLVEGADDVAGYKAAIAEITAHPQDAQRRAENAWRLVQKMFDPELYVSELGSRLDQIAAEKEAV